jgi:hypothetical protein
MVQQNSTETHHCISPYNVTPGNFETIEDAALFSAMQLMEQTEEGWVQEYGWLLAVTFALAGCTINNLGSNIQKLSYRFGSTENRNSKCIGVWASGFTLQILGAGLDMFALNYGDQTLIAPIGALALVANIGFARCIHNEDLSRMDLYFMGVIFAGCIVCTGAAPKHSCPISRKEIWQRFISFQYFWGYVIVITIIMSTLGAIVGMAELYEKKYGTESDEFQRLAKVHRIGYPLMAGVIGAQGVLIGNVGVTCIREIAEGLGGAWEGWEIFLFIFFTIFCLTLTFLQIAFLNKGLERYDAMLQVPIMQSLWIIFCIIGGGVFFDEFSGFVLWQYFIFPLGVLITIAGVILLGYFRQQNSTVNSSKVDPLVSKDSEATIADSNDHDIESGKEKNLELASKHSPAQDNNQQPQVKSAVVLATVVKDEPETSKEESKKTSINSSSTESKINAQSTRKIENATVVVSKDPKSQQAVDTKKAASMNTESKSAQSSTKPKSVLAPLDSRPIVSINTDQPTTPQNGEGKKTPSTPSAVAVDLDDGQSASSNATKENKAKKHKSDKKKKKKKSSHESKKKS